MLQVRGTKIAEELSNMFVGQSATGLELDQQASLDEEIGEEFAQKRTIFVKDIERMLLDHVDRLFAQTVRESILMHFLRLAMAEVAMQGKRSFRTRSQRRKISSFMRYLPFGAFCASLRPNNYSAYFSNRR